jgi:dimethylhistidine N-methyltransferase
MTNIRRNSSGRDRDDEAARAALIRREVLSGLQSPVKELPCKLFYDERGAQLFERICELDEYYLTRTDQAIMLRYAGEMATCIGRGAALIEYGSGAGTKTRILLDHLQDLVAYIPVDISREQLLISAADLAAAYPNIQVLPVHADYTGPFTLPPIESPIARKVGYFSGSTIGNFTPPEAVAFLSRQIDLLGPGGGMLIGADLQKDPAVLHLAYNDRAGVTAAFNLNILTHVNRELGADFQLDQFAHKARYNEQEGRIEMYLTSLADQIVHLDDTAIDFRNGERILTEVSYKYTLNGFAEIARRAGFDVRTVWTDERRWFSVQYLTVSGSVA